MGKQYINIEKIGERAIAAIRARNTLASIMEGLSGSAADRLTAAQRMLEALAPYEKDAAEAAQLLRAIREGKENMNYNCPYCNRSGCIDPAKEGEMLTVSEIRSGPNKGSHTGEQGTASRAYITA